MSPVDFGYTTLVTIASLFELLIFSFIVGAARAKFGVKAPAVSGNIEFEKRYRVQMNTLENIVIFLPSLWVFAYHFGDEIAAALGAVWIVGRALFAMGYISDPKNRSIGFMIGFLAQVILLLGAAYGAAKNVIKF